MAESEPEARATSEQAVGRVATSANPYAALEVEEPEADAEEAAEKAEEAEEAVAGGEGDEGATTSAADEA